MELLPIVCEQTGERTGASIARAEAIARGVWCQTTNVYVLNSAGEILCHQRSLTKERLPGVWMTHLGGHVGHDETYEENAGRELCEETGLTIDPASLIHWRTTRLPKARIWVAEYATLIDKPSHLLTPQSGEVEQFAWLSLEELNKQSLQNPTQWCVGTHDFSIEYSCLRAVLTAAKHKGFITSLQPIQTWMPLGSL